MEAKRAFFLPVAFSSNSHFVSWVRHFWASANAPDSYFGCRQILPSGQERKMSVPWPAHFDLSRIFATEPNARGGSLDKQQHDKPKQGGDNEWSEWTSSVRFAELTVVHRTPAPEELPS